MKPVIIEDAKGDLFPVLCGFYEPRRVTGRHLNFGYLSHKTEEKKQT